jgi:hypothetical protein
MMLIFNPFEVGQKYRSIGRGFVRFARAGVLAAERRLAFLELAMDIPRTAAIARGGALARGGQPGNAQEHS